MNRLIRDLHRLHLHNVHCFRDLQDILIYATVGILGELFCLDLKSNWKSAKKFV